MKSKLLIPVVAALAVLSACSSSSTTKSCSCTLDQVCVSGTCHAWEPLAGFDGYGLTDFTPKGSKVLYLTSDSLVEKYTIADDAWTDAGTELTLPGGYAYAAWHGDNLYAVGDVNVYTYSIADMTASSVAPDALPSFTDSQSTVDDGGTLYAVNTDGTILLYDLAAGTYTTVAGPTDLFNGDEPRAAWDSKTARLYYGDYEGTKLYAFNPTDSTSTPLADFPVSNGMNDAFCSDRKGHVYTAADCGQLGLVWWYDAATDQWDVLPRLPFEIGCSGSCTVSGDGYLYVNGYDEVANAPAMARLKVF